jgi:hypothetical protein
MRDVIYETENAIFKFRFHDALEIIRHRAEREDVDDAFKLLEFFTASSTLPTIRITPEGQDYFGYIALDLLGQNKGSVTCKSCQREYPAASLKPIDLGFGESPFDMTIKPKGGIRRLLRKKRTGMFGGKGYACPEGHPLITMRTWIT